ncbi:MAG: site-specific integrase [Planctomycetes bacterium]|nr:site-specific integrase [Planctomycetota bacterium]
MHEEIKVSVVEFGDRKFYMMQWRDPLTGRKQTKSTKILRTGKKRERREAERVAGEHEKALQSGQFKPPSKTTWGEFRNRYEDEVLTSKADGTFSKVSGVFNALEDVLNLADDTRLAALTDDRLSGYQSALRKAGRSEDTIKGHLAHLKAALRWAAEVGIISKPPKVRMPSRTKGGGKLMKGRPVTAEEFERMLGKVEAGLLAAGQRPYKSKGKRKFSEKAREELRKAQQKWAAAAAPTWERLLRGLWLSGLRLGEALDLYWDRDDRLCIDLSRRHPMLRIPGELEKGNQDRLLPITPDFAEFLLATPPEDRLGPVFAPQPLRFSGRVTLNYASRVLSAIGEAAGVKVNTDAKTGDVKFASAHDLRRSFGERWAARLMPQQLMELMRHESIETTMKFYVGRNAERTADAIWEAFSAGSGNSFGNTSQQRTPTGNAGVDATTDSGAI